MDEFWEIPATTEHRTDGRAAFARLVEASLAAAPRLPARRPPWRAAAAAGLTLGLALAVAATGGLSYAASSLRDASRVVHRASRPHAAIVVRGLTAGSDQYAPGFGFGDPEHNHDGPPGLEVAKSEAAEPPAATPADGAPGLAKLVGASISFDEQVHLYISVVGPRNRPLLLTQSSKRGGSKVGTALAGPQTKVIQYAVLVPRTIPIQLRVPANLLNPKSSYRIRIVAVDPQGNRSTVLIPFQG
jgi:hypothetical protein